MTETRRIGGGALQDGGRRSAAAPAVVTAPIIPRGRADPIGESHHAARGRVAPAAGTGAKSPPKHTRADWPTAGSCAAPSNQSGQTAGARLVVGARRAGGH